MKKITGIMLGAIAVFAVHAQDLSVSKDLKGWEKSRDARPVADTEVKMSNRCSIRLVNDTVKNTAVHRMVKLEPNTEYELTFYVKGKNIDAGQNQGARIALSGNKKFSRATTDPDGKPETGTFDWRKGVYRFSTARFQTGDIDVSLVLIGKGTVWYDNLELKKVSVQK